MEFKDFFSMMKNRISDGADVPYFFRDLMAMITDVSKDEWGTPKDPDSKLTNENILRTYAKRKQSKKFAQSIVYRLFPEMFISDLEEKPKALLSLLAEDYKAYDPSVNVSNVAEKLAYCFVEIIRELAGLVQQDELERQRLLQQSVDLKVKFGDYLFDEADNTCAFPGCGRSLIMADNGKVVRVFDIALIDKKKGSTVDNLLAMCPICHGTYTLDNNKKIIKELVGVKQILIAHKQSMRLLDGYPIEKEIIGVMKKVANLQEKDLFDLTLDPQDISKKLLPNKNLALYRTVKNYVDTYYINLKEIITNADKRGEIDYDAVQDHYLQEAEESK